MEMITPILDQSKLLRVAICFWTMMCVGGCLYMYLCVSLCSKINVCMLMYKLLYFLYVVYVCNDESMHTNIMYTFIQ